MMKMCNIFLTLRTLTQYFAFFIKNLLYHIYSTSDKIVVRPLALHYLPTGVIFFQHPIIMLKIKLRNKWLNQFLRWRSAKRENFTPPVHCCVNQGEKGFAIRRNSSFSFIFRFVFFLILAPLQD